MPGEIGASIFSTRPARGYRFHSLHVEIIVVLSRHAPHRFRKPGRQRLAPRFERLSTESVPASIREIRHRPLRLLSTGSIYLNWGTCCPFQPFSAFQSLASDHEIASAARPPRVLAGQRGREDDRAPSKK